MLNIDHSTDRLDSGTFLAYLIWQKCYLFDTCDKTAGRQGGYSLKKPLRKGIK